MGRAALAPEVSGARTIARSVDARALPYVPETSAGRAAARDFTSGERSAIVAGFAAAFIAAVEVVRWIRLDLFLDREPSWRIPRLLLALFAISVTGAAGVLAAGLCLLVARSRWGNRSALPLPVRRSSLIAFGAAVLLVGVLLRVVGTGALAPLWVDDLSEVRAAVGLRGEPSDLPPWSYPVPFREGRWGGSVGALYLEFFHLCLKTLGTTMSGVRAPRSTTSNVDSPDAKERHEAHAEELRNLARRSRGRDGRGLDRERRAG